MGKMGNKYMVSMDEAIKSVKISKLLFLTKNRNIFSYEAEEYIYNLNRYSVYCKDDQKDNWESEIRNLVYAAGKVSDNYILEELSARENAAIIMNRISSGHSWDEIRRVVKNQGHSGSSISMLGQIMLRFSPCGIDFVENVITSNKNAMPPYLREEYILEKNKQEEGKTPKK